MKAKGLEDPDVLTSMSDLVWTLGEQHNQQHKLEEGEALGRQV